MEYPSDVRQKLRHHTKHHSSRLAEMQSSTHSLLLHTYLRPGLRDPRSQTPATKTKSTGSVCTEVGCRGPWKK